MSSIHGVSIGFMLTGPKFLFVFLDVSVLFSRNPARGNSTRDRRIRLAGRTVPCAVLLTELASGLWRTSFPPPCRLDQSWRLTPPHNNDSWRRRWPDSQQFDEKIPEPEVDTVRAFFFLFFSG